MRHSSVCGGELRIEFFADKGEPRASVGVAKEFEDRPSVHCDTERLREVMQGLRYHLAGPGWLCTMMRAGEFIEFDLWREGQPARRCRVPVEKYQAAVQEAYGVGSSAYVS